MDEIENDMATSGIEAVNFINKSGDEDDNSFRPDAVRRRKSSGTPPSKKGVERATTGGRNKVWSL